MVVIRHTFAAVTASLFTMAAAQNNAKLPWTSVVTHISSPTVTRPASAMSTIGCFETGVPLQNYGSHGFQSAGNCQLICLQLNKDVLGLSDGENCWCGDQIPAQSWKLDEDQCSTTCNGDGVSNCGGKHKLWVILTGNTRNEVDYYEPPVSSSSSAVASSTAASKTSVAASSTATQAESAIASSKPKESGSNTTAIAVGVVVGIVGLAAIIGGVLFFLRRRRQRQAEEDYRRNAANVDSFVSGGKLHTSNSSMNDSRLDPIFVDRRQSNGSIADNEDYSRRILKVTNV